MFNSNRRSLLDTHLALKSMRHIAKHTCYKTTTLDKVAFCDTLVCDTLVTRVSQNACTKQAGAAESTSPWHLVRRFKSPLKPSHKGAPLLNRRSQPPHPNRRGTPSHTLDHLPEPLYIGCSIWDRWSGSYKTYWRIFFIGSCCPGHSRGVSSGVEGGTINIASGV
eukprot:COSAG01_NODE_119_length_25410_cov_1333.312275_11_plen_165_part_00